MLIDSRLMIRNVYLNGQIHTLLVLEEEDGLAPTNPILEALKEQAERIETLEQQNSTLMKQEELLVNLLELTAKTGSVMVRSLESLQKLENGLLEEESGDTSGTDDEPGSIEN